jgi:hypothetical protein
MAKSLMMLANQLRKNHGVHLVTTFDSGIEPGVLIERKKWSDIHRVARLTDDSAISATDLGPLEGPWPCLLADFTRNHEISLNAAMELLQPSASATAAFTKAKQVVACFTAPVIYGRSLVKLEDAIEKDPKFWERNLAQRLKSRQTFVVFEVVRSKLAFLFRGSGRAGIDLESTALKDLKRAGLSAGWSWRNEATLESKKEMVVGVEIARYNQSSRMLVTV